MAWDEEVFLKEIDYNKNQKYYCTNPLLKKIAESLKDNGRSGYKITECFNETELNRKQMLLFCLPVCFGKSTLSEDGVRYARDMQIDCI